MYFVRFPDEPQAAAPRVLLLAGLFDEQETEPQRRSFTILTKPAPPIVAGTLTRVPVVLGTEELVEMWLDRALSHGEAIQEVLANQSFRLVTYPVNNLVRNQQFNCEHCIEPIGAQIRR